MRKLRVIKPFALAVIFCFAIFSCSIDKKEKLKKRISSEIQKLQNLKQHERKQFIIDFADPALIESLKQKNKWQKTVQDFDDGAQRKLLYNLKIANRSNPSFPDKNTAIFDHETLDEKMIFTYVNGKWYLKGS